MRKEIFMHKLLYTTAALPLLITTVMASEFDLAQECSDSDSIATQDNSESAARITNYQDDLGDNSHQTITTPLTTPTLGLEDLTLSGNNTAAADSEHQTKLTATFSPDDFLSGAFFYEQFSTNSNPDSAAFIELALSDGDYPSGNYTFLNCRWVKLYFLATTKNNYGYECY